MLAVAYLIPGIRLDFTPYIVIAVYIPVIWIRPTDAFGLSGPKNHGELIFHSSQAKKGAW